MNLRVKNYPMRGKWKVKAAACNHSRARRVAWHLGPGLPRCTLASKNEVVSWLAFGNLAV